MKSKIEVLAIGFAANHRTVNPLLSSAIALHIQSGLCRVWKWTGHSLLFSSAERELKNGSIVETIARRMSR